MSANQTKQPHGSTDEGEVQDDALDAVSGGQGAAPLRKIEGITVTATRLKPDQSASRKIEPIVVTATRLPDASSTQVASAGSTKRPA